MQNNFLRKNGNLILLVGAALVFILHFLFFHGGYFGYDDIEYAQIADSLNKKTFFLGNNLYSYRWSVIFPLALIYHLFGVNDFSNALFTWLPLLGIIYVVLKCLKDQTILERLVATAFLVFCPIHLMYLEKPMPDIWVELGFVFTFYSYYSTLNSNVKQYKSAIIFVLGINILFLAKESFLIFYPYYLCQFIYDVFKKRNKQFWIIIILFSLLFVISYFAFFWWKTGQPFARINAIFSNQYLNECSYDKLPIQNLIDRILSGFWLCLIRCGYLIPIGFLFILKKENSPHKLILFSVLCLLFLSNFMSISYTSYVPMCPDPRHFMFLMPILAILFSIGFKAVNSKNIFPFGILIILQLYLSFHFQFENIWGLFLPILVGIIGFYFTQSKNILISFIFIGLFAQYFQNAKYNAGLHYAEQKQISDFVLKKPIKNALIVTDQVQANIGNFYLQFDTLSTKYIPFDRLEKVDTTIKQPTYLIINGLTSYLSGNQWEDLPVYVHDANKQYKLLLKNSGGELYLINPK